MRFAVILLAIFGLAMSSHPALAGKKDDAWAACIWEHAPVSAVAWLEMPEPERRQGVSEIKPEYALMHRLKAACYERLTPEGKERPARFKIGKVRESLIESRPEELPDSEEDPMAYVCKRFFLNDTDMENPAGYRWGFGPDVTQAQFGMMTLMFAAQGGGSVGLPEEGGLERCEFIQLDGSLQEVSQETTQVAIMPTEQQLAACIHEKDADLLVEIRDADSEDAFIAALERGAALCEMTDLTGFSMGRFFDAIAELIGAPSYEDAN